VYEGGERFKPGLLKGGLAILGFTPAVIVAALTFAAVLLTSASVLAGGNSGRQLLPPPPDAIGAFCGPEVGQVFGHAIIANAYIKTFIEHGGTVKMEIDGRIIFTITANGNVVDPGSGLPVANSGHVLDICTLFS
jgi:hypothetical protein